MLPPNMDIVPAGLRIGSRERHAPPAAAPSQRPSHQRRAPKVQEVTFTCGGSMIPAGVPQRSPAAMRQCGTMPLMQQQHSIGGAGGVMQSAGMEMAGGFHQPHPQQLVQYGGHGTVLAPAIVSTAGPSTVAGMTAIPGSQQDPAALYCQGYSQPSCPTAMLSVGQVPMMNYQYHQQQPVCLQPDQYGQQGYVGYTNTTDPYTNNTNADPYTNNTTADPYTNNTTADPYTNNTTDASQPQLMSNAGGHAVRFLGTNTAGMPPREFAKQLLQANSVSSGSATTTKFH